MLLTIDIGNTNITLGVWDGTQWRSQWRLRTVRESTVDEYAVALRTLLNGQPITRAAMSSVVPALTGTWIELCKRYLEVAVLNVNHQTDCGIVIRTDRPSEVGADRIVNSAAAIHLYGGPAIVIDMGTATTFDLVSADAALLGVVIAPGMGVSADALASRAAQLSGVELKPPPSVLGRNTVHSMQSGIIYGYLGLVEGIAQRLSNEYLQLTGETTPPKIIGTGGLMGIIRPLTTLIEAYDPWLTLHGLRIISDLNQPKE